MEARTLQISVLRLTTLATALAASLLLLAAASACQSQAEQPASPVATTLPHRDARANPVARRTYPGRPPPQAPSPPAPSRTPATLP